MTAVFWHIASPDRPIVSLTLPPKLFYVRHGRSQAYATEDGGFISRAPGRDIWDQQELKRYATMHFDWYNWGWESCFVSAFGDQEHAERWGRNPRQGQPVKVYELDMSKLPPGTLVLNAFMMCTFLGIEHQFNDNKDEYLFYEGIPGSCVGRCWDPWEDCPRVQFPRMQFPLYWFEVVHASEEAQTRWKQSAVSHRDKETHQEHGVEVKHQKSRGTESAAQASGERRRQLEELERQKCAESNTGNTLHDPDVIDLSGQMEVLDLETNFDNRTSPNTPNTTPESTTTAAATTTPNNPASTTATTPLRLSTYQAMKERRRKKKKLKKLERQKSAEPTINTLHDMRDPDVNDLAGTGRMKVLDLEGDVDAHTSDTSPKPDLNTDPSITPKAAPNTTPDTTTATAMTEAGSPATGAATGPLRGSVSQIRAMKRAQRETEERRRESLGGLKEKDKEAEGQNGGKVPRVR